MREGQTAGVRWEHFCSGSFQGDVMRCCGKLSWSDEHMKPVLSSTVFPLHVHVPPRTTREPFADITY